MENKIILITGANGFIGAALCKAFSTAGYQVRGVVRKIASGTLPTKWEMIEVGDFSNHIEWAPLLRNVHTVVHTAARVHQMKENSNNPSEIYRQVNTDATLQLLQQANQSRVSKFIFLSSIKVNGEDTIAAPFTEEDKVSPQDPYALSKYEAEIGIQSYCVINPSISFTIFRLPLVYGPGVKANFASLLHAVKRKYPLPLGAIHNQRSLLYIENLISVVQIELQQDQIKNQLYLLSDGDDVSSADLVQRMGAAFGVKPRLLSVPPFLLVGLGYCLGKTKAISRLLGSLQINSNKVRTLLQWTPPYTVASGLAKMAIESGKS